MCTPCVLTQSVDVLPAAAATKTAAADAACWVCHGSTGDRVVTPSPAYPCVIQRYFRHCVHSLQFSFCYRGSAVVVVRLQGMRFDGVVFCVLQQKCEGRTACCCGGV